MERFLKYSLSLHYTQFTPDNKKPIAELLTFCVKQSENQLHLSDITYIEIHVLVAYRNIPLKTII